MTNPLLPGYEVTPEGEWISSEHRRIAEIIADYSATPGAPELRLAYIRPADRETAEDHLHPFAVIQKLGDGSSVAVMVLREDELDERVIARIFAGDQSKRDVFAERDKMEAARKAMELKRKMDEIEMTKDFARTVIKSNKHSFQHNGVRYD